MWWQQKGSETSLNRNELVVPLLVRFGELNYIKVETDKTVSAILKDLQVNQNYGLVQVHRDAANKIIGRDILSGSDLIGKVAESIDLEVESPDLADLWLVDLSMEIGVFFNTYFRMVTGTPAHLLRMYVQPGMTVGDFESAIKRTLFIRPDDERFGLYGFADNEVVRLDPGLMMTELREKNAEPASKGSYFQFQMHAECEKQSHLGIARASNLTMRVNRGFRKTKKCWFALQGTSIFYRPSVKDHSDIREIPNVDECKVIYRGEQKKGHFRFDLVPKEGPVRVFTSPLKRRVIRWVRELRRCHRTLTINDPVTMGEVLKMKGVAVSPNSSLTRSKNASIRSLGFYQRRAIEVAEAHLQAVELDGGVILHNGIRWPGSFETGMIFVEDVRKLVLHMAKVEPTVTASENVSLIHELLKKIKGWVAFFEDGPRALKQQEEPDVASIREIVEAAQYLVNCYRVYQVKLGSGADDELQSESEKRILEEMLDNLQMALGDSIFEAKPVRRYIVRGAFKEERPPTPPPVEAKKAKAKVARSNSVQGIQEQASQSMTNLNNSLSVAGLIGRSGFEAGTAAQFAPETFPEGGILGSAPLNAKADKTALLRAANAEHFDEDEEVDRSKPSKMAWFRSKVSAFFQRPDFRHKRLEDEVEDDDDDVSFTVSFVSDPDRAADQKWADAKDLFKSKKDKSRSPKKSHSSKKNSERASSPLAAVQDGDEAGPVPISGFNGFGTKPAKKSRSRKTTPKEEPAAAANPWGVPDAQDDKPKSAAPSDEASSKRRSRRRASENLAASQPAPAEPGSPISNKRMSMPEPDRTGPEEEAEMLRMLKDPKIRSRLLAEMKEDKMPALQEPEGNNDAARGWGRGRRERLAQA